MRYKIYIKNKQNQSLSQSRYYAEACNEWQGPSPRLSAWATQLRRNVAAVASRWRHWVRFDWPGIGTPDLPHRLQCLSNRANRPVNLRHSQVLKITKFQHRKLLFLKFFSYFWKQSGVDWLVKLFVRLPVITNYCRNAFSRPECNIQRM